MDILDYRQTNVFRILFLFTLILTSVIGVLQLIWNTASVPIRYLVFLVYSLLLMIVSAFYGTRAKKAISIRSGKWKTVNKEISLKEYKKIAKKQNKDFSWLDEPSSLDGSCCCPLMGPYLIVVFVSIYLEEFLGTTIWSTITPLILLVIEYLTLGFLSYLFGYSSTKFEIHLKYTNPAEELYKFARTLSKIGILTTAVKVEVSTMESWTVLNDIRFVFDIDDLSNDIYIQLRVSDSNPDYGYLIGIMINGPTVEERTETVTKTLACPMIIEYSNDTSATVLVCRYDIETDGCRKKSISQQDIKKLASKLISQIRDLNVNYHSR